MRRRCDEDDEDVTASRDSTSDKFKTAWDDSFSRATIQRRSHGSVCPKLQGVPNEPSVQHLTILRPPVGSVFQDLSFKGSPSLLFDHFGITLGTLWGHFGVTLGSLWGHFEVTFGVTLGSLWHHFGIGLW